MHGARVLVTGATGFIGAELCRALTAAGAEVHGTTRRAPAGRDDPAVACWWRCDPAEPEPAARTVAAVQPDVLYHLSSAVTGSRDAAAVLPTFRDNLASAVNVLSAAHAVGVGRVVLAGSYEVDPQAVVPRSPYAAAKAGASAYGRMFHAIHGLPVVEARIAMCYGPGQRLPKLVPHVIAEALAGRAPEIASGRRVADWTYVDDVVAGLVAAGTAPGAPGHAIDLGTGVGCSVGDVAHMLTSMIDPAVRPRFGAVADRPMECEALADPEPAARLLGWRPRVDLIDGLRRTVEWFARGQMAEAFGFERLARARHVEREGSR